MHTTAATQCGVDNGGSCSKALQVLLFVVVVVVVIMAMLEVLPMAGAASTVLQWLRSLASVAWYRLCARATSVCCMLVQKVPVPVFTCVATYLSSLTQTVWKVHAVRP
jgi:hypothetical protein